MIQTLIIALPAFAALIVCLCRGPELALLDVYLPTLLLLPHHFGWPLSGQLPFSDSALVVIVLFLGLRSRRSWQWSMMDLLITAYVVITVVSYYINMNYKLAQNLALKEFCSLFLPYYAFKQTAWREEFATRLAKRIVLLLSIVAIVSVYELRMGSDLFLRPFSGIFPSQDTVVFRAGFMRTQGPFGHAMAAGVMMAVGYRLARWLDWNGIWHDRMQLLPISVIRFCEVWIFAGLVMTFSIGDWFGAVAAAVTLLIFRARSRKLAVGLAMLTAVAVGPPVYSAFRAYVSVDLAALQDSGDKVHQDAAYRNRLLQVYIPIVEERPTWGWGSEFPVIDGMWSIDDGYLWTALIYGLYALGAWLAILLWNLISLCALGFRLPRDHPAASAAFTLAAIFLIFAICNLEGALMTGPQIMRVFFLLTGWGVALVQSKKAQLVDAEVEVSRPQTEVAFQRVMA